MRADVYIVKRDYIIPTVFVIPSHVQDPVETFCQEWLDLPPNRGGFWGLFLDRPRGPYSREMGRCVFSVDLPFDIPAKGVYTKPYTRVEHIGSSMYTESVNTYTVVRKPLPMTDPDPTVSEIIQVEGLLKKVIVPFVDLYRTPAPDPHCPYDGYLEKEEALSSALDRAMAELAPSLNIYGKPLGDHEVPLSEAVNRSDFILPRDVNRLVERFVSLHRV